ncbi:MAG: response regulator transcription factor [Actinomycetota bacterium]
MSDKKKGKSQTVPQARIAVLLVEDEESFVDALQIGLTSEGFDVTIARDGVEALREFDEGSFDLILLDMMLPRLSGLDVCRTIRGQSDVPIIMVTAKSEEIDTVVALEIGADDYVTKPYRLRELVARMRAVLRRQAAEGTSSGDEDGFEVIELGDVRLELDRRRAIVRGEEVHLRRKEFDLLAILMENAGRVLTREVLIDRIWGSDYIGDTKTLDVHIKRVRTTIEADPKSPLMLTTIRGVGYRFDGKPKAD